MAPRMFWGVFFVRIVSPVGFKRTFWGEITDSPNDRCKKCLFLFQNIAMQDEIIMLALFLKYALFRTCEQKQEIFTSKSRLPEKIRLEFCERPRGTKRRSKSHTLSTAGLRVAHWNSLKCCSALFERRWSPREIQMR